MGRVPNAPEPTGVAVDPAWNPMVARIADAVRGPSRSARYSLTSAFGRGLKIGAASTAVIVASVPIWGMSRAFRHGELGRRHVELVSSRENRHLARGHGPCGRSGLTTLDERGLRSRRLTGTEPFSFIVIGDTGKATPAGRC